MLLLERKGNFTPIRAVKIKVDHAIITKVYLTISSFQFSTF